MRYEGPIYRPPSEADSLLVQATVGCPHNKCSFCMVYKKGPRFRVRPLAEIQADLAQAAVDLGPRVRSLFLPAGNTLAMPTAELAAVCAQARRLLPNLERITVYASMQSVLAQGAAGLARLKQAGLSRLHVGLESGHDPTLARVKKGVSSREQVAAGRLALEAGLELCLYVILGLAGPADSLAHASATAQVINRINAAGPLTVRLRTLVPKMGTLLLHQINKGRFSLCSPHQVLAEADRLLAELAGPLGLFSDHYTNYLDLRGALPADQERLRQEVAAALALPREAFRPDFVGGQ
ncbi:MAG: radical SAM protein [Desulfarculus sp.]|nr:MAG: radical SAM protein [Desulfarculus sp.]